jgi:acetyl esterase/lipase
MRISTLLLSTVLIFALAPAFVRAADAPASLPPSIDVWPTAAPGVPDNAPAEQWTESKSASGVVSKHVTNVSHPTLTIYRPAKEKDSGVAIMVCPGGGYRALMMSYEGEDVARWLNTIGITGILLKYRVPGPEAQRYLPALQDAQRSLSLIRSKAKEWNIDPARIGMLGFSAGGHLTAAVSTNFDKRSYEAIDAVDQVSCRPDFAVVIYPGGVTQKGSDNLSPEIRVSALTPPTFIVQATDDKLSENSVFLYLALKRAGVPVELHLYARGGHGFGIRPSTQPCATWPARCEEWMRSRGILGDGK